MVNAGALYINGLKMSWISGTSIGVTAGACRDSSNVNDIIIPNAIIVDATKVGPNGLDEGALVNNMYYAVYAIASSLSANPATNISQQAIYSGNGTFTIQPSPASTTTNNPQPAIILSTDDSMPLLPKDYDMYRRIGFVLTDGAAAILAFYQEGNGSDRTMYYDTAGAVLAAGASAVYANVNLSDFVPLASAQGGSTNVIFLVALTPTAAEDTVNLKPIGSASVNGIAIMSGDVAGVVHTDMITCPGAINGGAVQVEYKVAGAVDLSVAGYVDQL